MGANSSIEASRVRGAVPMLLRNAEAEGSRAIRSRTEVAMPVRSATSSPNSKPGRGPSGVRKVTNLIYRSHSRFRTAQSVPAGRQCDRSRRGLKSSQSAYAISRSLSEASGVPALRRASSSRLAVCSTCSRVSHARRSLSPDAYVSRRLRCSSCAS